MDKALQEAAPAGLVGLVALLGASALVAPFCYGGLGEPAPLAMWKSWIGGPFSIISDVALGLVVACGAEFARKTLSNDDDDDPIAAFEQNPSLAGQKAALWRVTSAASASPADAITAIAAWQLLVALSEELYYRGLIQNGAYHAVGAATGSGLVGAVHPYWERRPSSPWRTRASSRTWRTARARCRNPKWSSTGLRRCGAFGAMPRPLGCCERVTE